MRKEYRKSALEAGKAKEIGSLLELPKGVWPCRHVDFVSVKLISNF